MSRYCVPQEPHPTTGYPQHHEATRLDCVADVQEEQAKPPNEQWHNEKQDKARALRLDDYTYATQRMKREAVDTIGNVIDMAM